MSSYPRKLGGHSPPSVKVGGAAAPPAPPVPAPLHVLHVRVPVCSTLQEVSELESYEIKSQ